MFLCLLKELILFSFELIFSFGPCCFSFYLMRKIFHCSNHYDFVYSVCFLNKILNAFINICTITAICLEQQRQRLAVGWSVNKAGKSKEWNLFLIFYWCSFFFFLMCRDRDSLVQYK